MSFLSVALSQLHSLHIPQVALPLLDVGHLACWAGNEAAGPCRQSRSASAPARPCSAGGDPRAACVTTNPAGKGTQGLLSAKHLRWPLKQQGGQQGEKHPMWRDLHNASTQRAADKRDHSVPWHCRRLRTMCGTMGAAQQSQPWLQSNSLWGLSCLLWI